MAIRISCPSCDASLSFDDDKRGKKVRCKKCEESFTLNASNGKAKSSTAISNGKAKAKAKPKKADDDDDDDVPQKKKPAAKKGGMGMVLILGGVAAFLLLLCVGVIGGGAAFFYLGKAPTVIAENKEEPEKKVEPEKKKDPEPEKKKDPEPEKKKDPEPEKKTLTAEMQKVKQATVFLSALTATGKRYEGSGFLAVEDGVVITNAHVLGMLDATAPPPVQIDVTIYPGEKTETKGQCAVLAVDRNLDLVALRVSAPGLPTLPAFLTLEDSLKISEAQPVRVASFPVEAKKRKDFMLTPTMIGRVKRAPTGKIDEVQVGAGISPATSGGPVVTPAGMVVGIAGNDDKEKRATPSDVVKRFLDGSIGDGTLDKVANGKVPATYPLSDPLRRIQQVQVEVWTGPPGANRPYSYTPPTPLPGDGARKSQALLQQKTLAGGDVVLPTGVPSGQVVWLQPVISLKDGSKQWGVAMSVMPPAAPVSPYDLRPANLTAKLLSNKDRTVKLDAVYKITRAKSATNATIHADILENMSNDPEGAMMKTSYGALSDIDGSNNATAKQVLDLVHQLPLSYSLDGTGKIGTKRVFRQLDQKLPKDQKEPADALQFQINTAFELGLIPVPNKTVKPGDTWATNYSVLVHSKKKVAEATVTLTSTYEGFLKREAVVTLKGKLQVANNPDFKFMESNITGKYGFDEAGGYISSTNFKLKQAGDSDNFSLDVDITRSSGNPNNIQLVQDMKQPDKGDGKPKLVLDTKGAVNANTGFDPQLSTIDVKKKINKIAYKQDIPLQMTMGKTYTIQVNAMGFNPYIKLYGGGAVVQQQQGGRMTFRAPATAPFVISVISHNHTAGTFQIQVHETAGP